MEIVRKKEQLGITLVALVVTIIVLLILAGVTISLVLGQTGIFSKAEEAKLQTEESQLQEEIKLAWLTVKTSHNGIITGKDMQIAQELKMELDSINSNTTAEYNAETNTIEGVYKTKKYKIEVETGIITLDGKVNNPEEPKEPAVVGEIVTEYNKVYTDEQGKTSIIPVGFAIVPGCEKVAEGLVISDVANDTQNIGNQFVWIPVDDNNFGKDFVRRAGYQNGVLQDLSEYQEANSNGNNNLVEEDQITQKEAMTMYGSVKSNGGFYIGRYETGKDESGNVVVKKNITPYVAIKWGNSMTDTTGGAVEKARSMYTDKSKYGITSTLCYGVQWDSTLYFIDPNYTGFAKDSLGKGNYSGSKINTGSNEAYKIKNIYDMAGNVSEWTMEAKSNDNRVYRGGNYIYAGNIYPCSYRTGYSPTYSSNSSGFRITLYI